MLGGINLVLILLSKKSIILGHKHRIMFVLNVENHLLNKKKKLLRRIEFRIIAACKINQLTFYTAFTRYKNMKRFLLLFTCLMVNICAFSQATSLEVDCQTPGWLSSKINYGDQLTVERLRITGYINSFDLKFIGTLMENSLKDKLDLSDIVIVKDDNEKDNELIDNVFSLQSEVSIRCIELPKSITAIDSHWGLKLIVDTLIIGSNIMSDIDITCLAVSGNSPSVIILREGVENITSTRPNYTSDTPDRVETELKSTKSIVLPKTIKSLPRLFLANSTKISTMNLPDSIKSIGEYAFVGTDFLPKELYLPKSLEKFDFNILCNSLPDVLFIPENVSHITNTEHYDNNSGSSWSSSNAGDRPVILSETMEIHIKSKNIPSLSVASTLYPSSVFKNCTIYVPSDLVDSYKEKTYYKNATILPEKEITELKFNTNKAYYVGEEFQLSASFLPSDATDKLILWSSSDNEVISVTKEGKAHCNKYGKATITASTSYGKLSEKVDIYVYEPTTGVELSKDEIIMNVGDTTNLQCNVLPLGTSDGRVVWSSSDDNVAFIDNDGNIFAKNSGTCNLTCTSVSRGYKAVCKLVVNQPVENIQMSDSLIICNELASVLELSATIYPENATNKEVSWNSSNEAVCKVIGGTVIIIGWGTSIISAITVDGGHMATCTIVVEEPTGIDNIYSTKDAVKVFDINGKVSSLDSKGIKIIRFEDGTSLKIVIK